MSALLASLTSREGDTMIGYREKVEWTKREVVSNPS